MALNAVITTELMDEFKSSSNDVRVKVERFIGEAVVNILNQNESRFRRLEKSTTLTFVAGDDVEKLPADFRSIKKPLIEVESDGTLIATVEIVTDAEFLKRKQDLDYGGAIYARIETRQMPVAAEYLILNVEPTETRYFKLEYYRVPQASDADMINDAGVIKDGVRNRFPEFVGANEANGYLIRYERGKIGLIENPSQRATGMALRPSRRTQRYNRNMFRYGRGR
jgi:hypothetical protein